MRDITLRFDNREQFNAIVYDSGLFSLEEENGVLVDVIGCIIDYEEPENERCTGIDRGGFFVNMRIVDGRLAP
ncbi:hypothetical protein [Escherichia coli]|uniref:hypothetical protein n=1 Tax=Escherichia coli TaxID=562 RepID=UPI00148D8BCE|nr:hypothetical protein [Escherichia coli]NOG82031.1 hypothetical protein [Escherichia coli]